MHPIVDGLETEYNETVEFIKVNASTAEGLEIFESYGMFGHPSYLILDEQGQMLWQNVGEQPAESLEDAILNGIDEM